MAATIVELDALTDTVWTAAENDDLLAIRYFGFRTRLTDERRFIGRVHVCGWRCEFGCAGINALIDRMHVELITQLCDIFCILADQSCKTRIGEAHSFKHAQVFGILRKTMFADAGFCVDDAFDLFKEPWIDFGDIMHLLGAEAEAHCLCDHAQTVWRWRADCGADRVLLVAFLNVWNGDFIKTRQACFQTAQRFLQAFLESTANGHDFTDRFHGSGQDRRGTREFFKRKAWDLGDDIVDRRFERCGCCAAGDVVVEFVECVADCKFGCDLCNREASGFRCKRRGARYARVHFNHDHTAIGWVNRELNVGAASFNADLAQHRNRGVTHDLVFFVGQRQRRGDRDTVARMHAHWIEVFD